MASIIEVNTATLKSDVETIRAELMKIRENAERLSQVLHELGSMWDGNAKQAFSAAVNSDIAQLTELVKAMQNFTGKTGEAREEYDKCENTVAQIVAAIRV